MSWTQKEHKKLYPGLGANQGLGKWIVRETHPQKLLEFGCGTGVLLNYIHNFSLSKKDRHIECAVGIEPEKMNEYFLNPNGPTQICADITEQDISNHPIFIKNPHFDLILSVEVMEHIDRKYHQIVFDFLASKASKWIVFSGARMGQVGHGHIACRAEEDWRSEWISRGFTFLPTHTNSIRAHSDNNRPNHRKNMQVFIKNEYVNLLTPLILGPPIQNKSKKLQAKNK